MLYFMPVTREQKSDTIILRKHWIILFGQIMRPLFVTFVALAAMTIVLVVGEQLSGLEQILSLGIAVAALIGGLAWLWWEYADWHNDLYILTPSAVVDEERRPLGLRQEVRRAGLEQIQDVRYEIPNFILMTLGVGHVFLQTAGSEGQFTFLYVKNPREVQFEIFQYIQSMQSRQRQRESARLNQELLEMLKLYQEETKGAPLPDAVIKAETPKPATT